MKKDSRRQFLKRAGQTGLAVAATSALGRFGIAQAQRVTRVVIDSGRQISEINPHLFGSFLEQLGRAIYEGIYEPGSKFADGDGFRTDVMKEIHDLGVPNFALAEYKAPENFPKAACPLCAARVPITEF